MSHARVRVFSAELTFRKRSRRCSEQGSLSLPVNRVEKKTKTSPGKKNERVPHSVVHLHSNYTNIGQIARRVNRLDDRSLLYASLSLSSLFCTRRPRFSDDHIFIYYAVRTRKQFYDAVENNSPPDNARCPFLNWRDTSFSSFAIRTMVRNGSICHSVEQLSASCTVDE